MWSVLLVGIVALVACDAGKKQPPAPVSAAPLRLAFGDCAASDAPFVSGPRPLALADRVPSRVTTRGVDAPHDIGGAGSDLPPRAMQR